MLSPSFETTRSTSLSRQKNHVGDTAWSDAKQTSFESQKKLAFQHPKIKLVNDKAPEQKKSASEHNNNSSDYTLALSHQTSASSTPTATDLKPDEIRFGRKRPDLPITFSFGIRRSQAVAVAMRHPLLEGKQPTTANQAILDTFDLAATNRLPYAKGTGINIAA